MSEYTQYILSIVLMGLKAETTGSVGVYSYKRLYIIVDINFVPSSNTSVV